MAEALPDNRWVVDIRGARSIAAVVEFLHVWEALADRRLSEESGRFTWKLTANGVYSAKSAYEAFFLGRENFPAAEEIWSSGAPLNHKLHMWFTLRRRLWTADRLVKRGLDHPTECVLCCQEQETTDHLTMQCVFAREVWYTILQPLRLHHFTPTTHSVLELWWPQISGAAPKQVRKELNSLICLVARSFWLERNSRVFDKVASLP